MKDNNGNVLILDTKYKLVNDNGYDKYGISQGDMYQMCSYVLKGSYKNLDLIYPKTFELNDDINFVINSGFGDIYKGTVITKNLENDNRPHISH